MKFKVPKTVGEASDRLYNARKDRLAAQKVVDAHQEEETALSNWLIDNLPTSKAEGVIGKISKSVIIQQTIPIIENWDALCKYVKKTGSFEFFQRRLSTDAVKERWEQNKAVPGVGKFDKKKVSVTKR